MERNYSKSGIAGSNALVIEGNGAEFLTGMIEEHARAVRKSRKAGKTEINYSESGIAGSGAIIINARNLAGEHAAGFRNRTRRDEQKRGREINVTESGHAGRDYLELDLS